MLIKSEISHWGSNGMLFKTYFLLMTKAFLLTAIRLLIPGRLKCPFSYLVKPAATGE